MKQALRASKDFDTQDTSNRHATDAELREKGFVIHSRPERGEPVWRRGSILYAQAAAERLLSKLKTQ